MSVVIPARNAAATLGAQLAAVVTQRAPVPFEVVVVDNCSTDRTRAVAEQFAAEVACVRVARAPTVGRSHARNVGAREARGDLLLYCDADDVVEPGWVAAMTASAAHGDLVSGRVVAFDGSEWPTDPSNPWMGFLPIAPGCSFGVWRDVIERVGGWNERYVRCEDTELSWRIQLTGHVLVRAPDAVLRYRERPTAAGAARQRFETSIQRAHLYREFRGHGVTRRSLTATLRIWARLAWRVRRLFEGSARRKAWLGRCASQAGRVVGSVRFRVVYP